METQSIQSTLTNEINKNDEKNKYAGFWIRLLAYIIDSLILSIPSNIINKVILNTVEAEKIEIAMVKSVISFIILSFYFVIMTYRFEATVGKMILKLKVVSEDRTKLSFWQLIKRETIGKFFSAVLLGIGFIMIAFNKQKKGIHDQLANTLVVYKN
jgi:uncharacterized RDD family membrane protein YckC